MNRFEPRLNWLRIFPCLRNKCFICNKTESFGPENILIGCDEIEGLYCNTCWEEYSDVFEEIRFKFDSASESGSSQETNDTDSSD